MTAGTDYQIFEAGDVALQSGVVFRSLRLAYQTYGTLNANKDNVIVYPTSFSAQHYDTEWLIQPGGILDPDCYFIVIPNLFCNGLSSSPSNSGEAPGSAPFPDISYHDAVAVQRRDDFVGEHALLVGELCVRVEERDELSRLHREW